MNKKSWIMIVSVILVLAVGFLVYTQINKQNASADISSVQTATAAVGDLSITIDAAGSLQSATSVALSFQTSGTIMEIPVELGDEVVVSQVLARLDDAESQSRLAQAELDLATLTSPYALAEAEQKLADAYEVWDDADYTRLSQQKGYRSDAFTLDTTRAELLIAEDNLEKAEDKYDRLADKPEDNLRRAQALAALSAAVAVRDDLLLDLQWYLGEPDDIEQQGLDADVAIAEANINCSTALIAYLNKEPISAELEAYVCPDLSKIYEAELNVNNAKTELQKTNLNSPIKGVVTTLNHQVGEFVSIGQTSVILSDLNLLEAVVNLDETDVSRVTVGMPVKITVDAFAGEVLEGVVTDIALDADVQSGVVLYPVTVLVKSGDLPLRSGMTIDVSFPIQEKKGVLIVPFRAVETMNGQAFVTKITTAGEERVPVTFGLITDTQIEILSGLNPGDVITVFANPVQDSELMNNPMFGGG